MIASSCMLPWPRLYSIKRLFTIVCSFILELFSPSVSAGSLALVQFENKNNQQPSSRWEQCSLAALCYLPDTSGPTLYGHGQGPACPYVRTFIRPCLAAANSLSHSPKLQSSSRVMCSPPLRTSHRQYWPLIGPSAAIWSGWTNQVPVYPDNERWM